MRPTTVLTARPAAARLTISAYPNPVREALTLRLPTNAPATLALRNALGQVVYLAEATPGNGQFTVSVGQLARGLYVLTVSQQG